MRFWDREKEIKNLKAHIKSEPNSILFVYGPKSSGKSTLLFRVVKDLSKRKWFVQKYDVYWYDLRGKFVSSYRDVVDIFFRVEDTEAGKFISSVESEMEFGIPVIASFKVKASLREEFYSKLADPFEYMEAVLTKSRKRHIIVFDELQKLKDIYVNGGRKVINELFNFFVRLTKVLHLAHVIVMTSDTFFIEEIYGSSSLKNTSEYYLVDYFDDERAFKILVEEGLSEEEARYVVEHVGGVPWIMERVLSNGNVKEKIEEFYQQHRSRLFGYIDEKKIKGEDVKISLKVLEEVMQGKFPSSGEELLEMRRMVEAEILFYDPLSRVVKFQTRLDERAARELIR